MHISAKNNELVRRGRGTTTRGWICSVARCRGHRRSGLWATTVSRNPLLPIFSSPYYLRSTAYLLLHIGSEIPGSPTTSYLESCLSHSRCLQVSNSLILTWRPPLFSVLSLSPVPLCRLSRLIDLKPTQLFGGAFTNRYWSLRNSFFRGKRIISTAIVWQRERSAGSRGNRMRCGR